MNKNLLILGAGEYGMLVQEIAKAVGTFEKISFLDDNKDTVLGKLSDYTKYKEEYTYALAAIGHSDTRMTWLTKLEEAGFEIPVLVSPRAYVSPSAQLHKGVIVEQMAVVQTGTIIGKGCLISSNATVSHNSFCGEGCHIDCGAVVVSDSMVPARTKVSCGEVFELDRKVKMTELFSESLDIAN